MTIKLIVNSAHKIIDHFGLHKKRNVFLYQDLEFTRLRLLIDVVECAAFQCNFCFELSKFQMIDASIVHVFILHAI